MRRIARQQDAPALKALGDESETRGPCRAPQDLDRAWRAYGLFQHGVDARVADLEVFVTGLDLRVKDEVAATVDRAHEAAPFAIEGPIHPGLPMRNDLVKVRRAKMQHVHASAHEVALRPGFADVADSKLPTHETARAVAPDQPGRPKSERRIVLNPRRGDFDMIAVVSETGQPNAVSQRDRRQFRGMFVEDWLDEHLRTPMRQFGRAPIAGQLPDHAPRVARRGQFDARQFVFCVAGEIGHVSGVIRRHSKRANFVSETKPTIVLHGARLGRVGLRIGEVPGFSSMRIVDTPRRPSSFASMRPQGPPPAIKTAASREAPAPNRFLPLPSIVVSPAKAPKSCPIRL